MQQAIPPINITLSDDGATVTLAGPTHAHAFPVADLPKWIKTYKDLRDRNKGQYARFYITTCDRLAAFAKDIAAGQGAKT